MKRELHIIHVIKRQRLKVWHTKLKFTLMPPCLLAPNITEFVSDMRQSQYFEPDRYNHPNL